MAKAAPAHNNPKAPLPDPPRSFVTQSVAAILPKVTKAAFRKKSPAGALLMTDWAQIVGPGLAAVTMPQKLHGTTLTLACNGAIAMELSHQAASLTARINTYAGQRLVETLRFVQNTTAPPRAAPKPEIGPPLPIKDFPPGEVHDALARLAAALAADRPPS